MEWGFCRAAVGVTVDQVGKGAIAYLPKRLKIDFRICLGRADHRVP
jgi:hypothetical protein